MPLPATLTLLRRNRDFRRLWLGVVSSFFGDWFTTIALYEMVQTLSDSALAVSGVLVAKTLPVFLVMPLAGRLADRFDRRDLMVGTDLLRALLTLALLGAWWARSLPLVFLVEVVRMGVAGVFIPCREAVVPQLTQESELAPALSLLGATWSVMLALGAAAGGLVTAGIGVDGALWVDGATFLVSAAFLWGLPPLPPEGGGGGPVRFTDGLRSLRGRPALTVLLSMKAGQALATGALATIPFFGNGVFPATAGPLWVGVLYASRGVGAIVGSLGLPRLLGHATPTLLGALLPLFLLQAATYALTSRSPSVTWAAAGFGVVGLCNAGIWVFSNIVAQRTVPEGVRGRLFALDFGVMTLFASLSALGSGLLMDLADFSPRQVLVVIGLALLVPAAAAGWLGRQVHRL